MLNRRLVVAQTPICIPCTRWGIRIAPEGIGFSTLELSDNRSNLRCSVRPRRAIAEGEVPVLHKIKNFHVRPQLPAAIKSSPKTARAA
jgi:hypothetical protein